MSPQEIRDRAARRDERHALLICGAATAFLLAILVGAFGGAG